MLINLILLFGFSTFVTVVWIGTTLFHNSVTSKISQSNKIKIEPIEPNFDIQTLDSLKGRQSMTINLSENLEIIESLNEDEATQSAEISTQSAGIQNITQ